MFDSMTVSVGRSGRDSLKGIVMERLLVPC